MRMDLAQYKYIIVGSGLTGATVACALAQQGEKDILVLEKNDHTGGLAYDCPDANGLTIHPYGPHIFHTNNLAVVRFLSKYTSWRPYRHQVAFWQDGRLVPLPFSLRSLRMVFPPDEADLLQSKLLDHYPYGDTVSIRALRSHADPCLAKLGEYVYENVYLQYSQKQWGVSPALLDPSVPDRVPFRISQEKGYFRDAFQAMPAHGYAQMIDRMLGHRHIRTVCGCDAMRYLCIRGNRLMLHGARLRGGQHVICTASLDSLFQFREGVLPFRAISLRFETIPQPRYQPVATVNYTHSEPYTRITEFKHLTGERAPVTTIAREYPQAYTGGASQLQAYPLPTEPARARYARYRARADRITGLHCIGRLAEYRYLNMDECVAGAMAMAAKLLRT